MFNKDNDYAADDGEESYDETFDAGYTLKGALTAGLILATGAVGCGESHPGMKSMEYGEAQDHIEEVNSESSSFQFGPPFGTQFDAAVRYRSQTTSSYTFKPDGGEFPDFYYFDRTYENQEGPDGQVVYQGKDGWKQVDGVQEFLVVPDKERVLALVGEGTALEIERVEAEDGYYTEEWVNPDKYSEEEIDDLINADDGLREDSGS